MGNIHAALALFPQRIYNAICRYEWHTDIITIQYTVGGALGSHKNEKLAFDVPGNE